MSVSFSMPDSRTESGTVALADLGQCTIAPVKSSSRSRQALPPWTVRRRCVASVAVALAVSLVVVVVHVLGDPTIYSGGNFHDVLAVRTSDGTIVADTRTDGYGPSELWAVSVNHAESDLGVIEVAGCPAIAVRVMRRVSPERLGIIATRLGGGNEPDYDLAVELPSPHVAEATKLGADVSDVVAQTSAGGGWATHFTLDAPGSNESQRQIRDRHRGTGRTARLTSRSRRPPVRANGRRASWRWALTGTSSTLPQPTTCQAPKPTSHAARPTRPGELAGPPSRLGTDPPGAGRAHRRSTCGSGRRAGTDPGARRRTPRKGVALPRW
jgi:hypothetical protein